MKLIVVALIATIVYLWMEVVRCIMIRVDTWEMLCRMSVVFDKDSTEKYDTGWVFCHGSMTTVYVSRVENLIVLRVARRPGAWLLARFLLPDVYIETTRVVVVCNEDGIRKSVIDCGDRQSKINLWSKIG